MTLCTYCDDQPAVAAPALCWGCVDWLVYRWLRLQRMVFARVTS